MKIFQVIHGYPMRYNAGSEVYTQGLAQALAERHEVHVFTRQENAFLPEYATQRETDPSGRLGRLRRAGRQEVCRSLLRALLLG